MSSKMIQEGEALTYIPIQKKISKKLPVFYNPIMKTNRDISILLLNAIKRNNLQISLPLSGTGIRGIRFLLELNKDKIKHIYFNDYSDKATALIKKNIKKNKLSTKNISISTKDANLFILGSKGFDYIDIDPFGTPNPFLDSAMRRLSRKSILAVTATDTSALCGSYPQSCLRKYWAKHQTNPMMHELGLRILIRKAQLVASQYDKALTPIFSYSKDHYMRVFFNCEKSKEATNKILKQHDFFNNYGPLWVGELWDKKLAEDIAKSSKEDYDLHKFLSIIAQESKISTIGFFNIHKIVKEYKLKTIPKKEELFQKIKSKKYNVSLTHFNPISIRSNIPLKVLIKLIRSIK